MSSNPAPVLDVEIALPGPSDTDALGGALARALRAGDTLLLSGPIGAGKSHLARAIIQALMAARDLPAEDIPSPTYTLVQTYDLGDLDVWHADLYRLGGPEEVFEIGLDAAFDTALCLIEWPDRLGESTPEQCLSITLRDRPNHEGRIARLHSGAARWSVLERDLRAHGAAP